MMNSRCSLQTIQSLRFGTRAHDDGIGRVLYWSSRAIALLFQNRVITLLNRYGVLLPSAVIADIDSFPKVTSAYFNDNQIILDSMVIELSNPIDLSFHKTVELPVEELLNTLRPFLKIKSHSIANAVLRIEGRTNYLSGIEKAVADRQFNILTASSSIEQAIENLLGLGFGLTPSGDDFALGVISVFNLLGRNTDKIRQGVISYDFPLSKTMLLDALDGFYAEPLCSLLESLSRGNISKELISDLLKTGHSSGSDILSGIYYSLLELSKQPDGIMR